MFSTYNSLVRFSYKLHSLQCLDSYHFSRIHAPHSCTRVLFLSPGPPGHYIDHPETSLAFRRWRRGGCYHTVGCISRRSYTRCLEFGSLLSSFRPTLSFASLIHDPLKPPRRYKKKALLIGVESKHERLGSEKDTPTSLRPLTGPHKDAQDMRQFLIGRFNNRVLDH